MGEDLKMQLELEKLKLETRRQDEERRDREHQREIQEQREREHREAEKEQRDREHREAAAHERMMQMTFAQQAANSAALAQTTVGQTAITANAAMSTAHAGGGGGGGGGGVSQVVQQTTIVQTAYRTEQYCGIFSWLLCILCMCPCIICCPIDSRKVPMMPQVLVQPTQPSAGYLMPGTPTKPIAMPYSAPSAPMMAQGTPIGYA